MEQKIRRDRNMGDNLRRLRDASGLSQEKLCAELQRRGCDIARSCYAKYEAGELNIRASVLIELRKIPESTLPSLLMKHIPPRRAKPAVK
jgi:transcriptional regulator with XRE-family HTH domain